MLLEEGTLIASKLGDGACADARAALSAPRSTYRGESIGEGVEDSWWR